MLYEKLNIVCPEQDIKLLARPGFGQSDFNLA